MKKKRFASLLIAAPLALLAACSSTPSLELNQNWFSNTGRKDIPEDFIETLEYDITFEKSDSALKGKFYADYSNGTYKTTFRYDSTNGQTKYVYETELSIDVKFTLNEKSADFHDTVTTHVEFLEAQNNLKPLSSWREVHEHAPETSPSSTPSSLEAGYKKYDYKTETVYDYDSYKANFTLTYLSVKKSENSEPKDDSESKQLKFKSKGLFVDNEQLFPTLRAAELSSSMAIYTIDPTTVTVNKLSIKDKPTDNDSWKQKVKLKGDETAVEHDFKVTTLGIAYNKKNSGGTHTFTLARRSDSADNNTLRNVVLEYSYPVINSHGTLTYKLVSADFYG